ncbi:unnamed protein product [Mytilus edulis]|uniref:Uncharacterized protein n=1 Tax=Mytilus edulis TaxID=6550 RepID=A0A8S3QGF9_MYTED|nr:unnamed protein product [Mytilus edulis]
MKYQVIVLLVCAIRNSSQRNSTEGVCYNSNGLEDCCFNYEVIKGICTECKRGTTAVAGGPCVPCTENTYGSLCIQKCNCTQFQRCDSEVGCILKTSIVTINLTNTGSKVRGKDVTTNQKTVYKNRIEDDEVGYFDLYFVLKEGPNDQVKEQTSQNELLSTSSFYANVVGQDKTEYHKTYMSPNEYCIDDIYACDVAVTVHKGMERSSRPDEDAKYNMYSKVNKTLQTDWTINSPANESHLSSESQPVYKTTLLEVFRTYLQDCTYKYASLEKTIDDCGAIKPNDENSFIKEKSKTF